MMMCICLRRGFGGSAEDVLHNNSQMCKMYWQAKACSIRIREWRYVNTPRAAININALHCDLIM